MIDHFYQQHHRRLRERFGLERVVKHQDRIAIALERRRFDTCKCGGRRCGASCEHAR